MKANGNQNYVVTNIPQKIFCGPYKKTKKTHKSLE